ncbi:hypothetical protein [Chamaesiphon polymorphus]|uniref:hypothetical protein n=1 Tax=Chamaesiphon polymorphus TaxID=2107691 RepID=UPI0015E64FF9|nr:hypothetical protein [Chamaesiphon polymorphus]
MTCVTFFTLTRSLLAIERQEIKFLKLNPKVSFDFQGSSILPFVNFSVYIYGSYV